MKDPGRSVGHKYEEMKPYMEQLPDYKDPGQTEFIVSMGYTWKKRSRTH